MLVSVALIKIFYVVIYFSLNVLVYLSNKSTVVFLYRGKCIFIFTSYMVLCVCSSWETDLFPMFHFSPVSAVILKPCLLSSSGSHFLPEGARKSGLLLPVGASFLSQPAGGSTHRRGATNCFINDEVCGNKISSTFKAAVVYHFVIRVFRLMEEQSEEMSADRLNKDLKALAKQTKSTKYSEVMKLLRLALSGLQVLIRVSWGD